MSVGKGQIDVVVLEDGTIRAETGDMGGVAHTAADDFLKMVQRLMGGAVEVGKAKQSHAHHHDHAHDHDHDHHHGGH